MKADSGASGNYIKNSDKHVLDNLQSKLGPQVTLPDSTTIQSTQTGHLPIPGLSAPATTSHVFNDLHSSSLLSVGKMCDDDCLVVFDKEYMRVLKIIKKSSAAKGIKKMAYGMLVYQRTNIRIV